MLRPTLWWLVPALLLATGCRKDSPSALRITLADRPDESLRLIPKSAFAEFVEHSAEPAELRVTLADYPLSCDRYRRPPGDHFLLNVVLNTPPGEVPEAGAYPFRGEAKSDERPEARASLLLRQGSKVQTLPPGGIVQLTHVALEPAGRIEGTLSYKFVGDKDLGPASVEGRFSAEVCRAVRLPGKQRSAEKKP